MIFVQATDDLFYINPIIHGKNWYLQCGDDGCEVHVKIYPRTNRDSARKRALKVLRQDNVSVRIKEYIGESSTIFSGSNELALEAGFLVDIRKPIPIPTQYDEVVNSPVLEHSFLAWKFDFSREQIESVLDDSKRMNYLLVKFLTGKTLVKEADRRTVKRLLSKLVPDPLPEVVTLEV